MYQRILRDPLNFPDDMHPDAKSIMTGLLSRDPAKRLGVNGGEEIKRHPFFKTIDWNKWVIYSRWGNSTLVDHYLGYLPRRFSLRSSRVWYVPHPRFPCSMHANHLCASQESVLDVANFDSEFTSEAPEDSVVADSKLSETVQEQFKGFTFNPNNEHLSESVGYPGVVGWVRFQAFCFSAFCYFPWILHWFPFLWFCFLSFSILVATYAGSFYLTQLEPLQNSCFGCGSNVLIGNYHVFKLPETFRTFRLWNAKINWHVNFTLRYEWVSKFFTSDAEPERIKDWDTISTPVNVGTYYALGSGGTGSLAPLRHWKFQRCAI